DRQNCLCDKAIESRSHIVTERELYKEEQDVLEGEMLRIAAWRGG
ncbi:unnamed protein product, partial [Sphacelaria rigidula]